MYKHILTTIRLNVQAGRIIMTNHAVREMKNDSLTFKDVVHSILTGEIVEQQYDPDRKEYKYILYGDTLDGNEAGVVAKLGTDDTVVITVYRLDFDDYDY